ncbi:MAG: APC family permease [Nitrososphaerota archaeon]|nr:APC family permease [Nitrososphaerota archaeon]MDG6924206.1 APC family permease [Nitrososphaerota archaeon]
MTSVGSVFRGFAFIFKAASAAIGLVILAAALISLAGRFTQISGQRPTLPGVILVISILAILMSGIALLTLLPNSIRARFARRSQPRKSKQVYGFVTVLTIGLGTTLGSPLFILIPQNVIQYEFVSIVSLLLASAISIGMARVYARMYETARQENLSAVGGPSFVGIAVGKKSARYFVARLSSFISNATLAAYSAIAFVVFAVTYIPSIMESYSTSTFVTNAVVYLVIGMFAVWFLINSVFEKRFTKLIGSAQIVLTLVMVFVLIYQSGLLGSLGGWNMKGMLQYVPGNLGPNIFLAIAMNTAFLYLLFFGFQEIQALERDAKEESSIPILSQIKAGYKMKKDRYLNHAMILSVVIASAINILYALAVFSTHTSTSAIMQAQIPAIYLANVLLGKSQEVLIAITFLIATFTTFVPAFLAASRHLGALGEDGFLPHSISKVAWIFVFFLIPILAITGMNFLSNMTGFMSLIRLGLIALSAIWLRKGRKAWIDRKDTLPLVVGMASLGIAGAMYFLSVSVAVYGAVAIAAIYLMYDIIQLGSFGSQLFLCIFDAVCYMVLSLYPSTAKTQLSFFSGLYTITTPDFEIIKMMLGIVCLILLVNIMIDARLSANRVQKMGKTTLRYHI